MSECWEGNVPHNVPLRAYGIFRPHLPVFIPVAARLIQAPVDTGCLPVAVLEASPPFQLTQTSVVIQVIPLSVTKSFSGSLLYSTPSELWGERQKREGLLVSNIITIVRILNVFVQGLPTRGFVL